MAAASAQTTTAGETSAAGKVQDVAEEAGGLCEQAMQAINAPAAEESIPGEREEGKGSEVREVADAGAVAKSPGAKQTAARTEEHEVEKDSSARDCDTPGTNIPSVNDSSALPAEQQLGCPNVDESPPEAVQHEPNIRSPDQQGTPMSAAARNEDSGDRRRRGGSSPGSPRVDLGLKEGWLKNLEAKMGAIKAQVPFCTVPRFTFLLCFLQPFAGSPRPCFVSPGLSCLMLPVSYVPHVCVRQPS